jgi:hypothetical protein
MSVLVTLVVAAMVVTGCASIPRTEPVEGIAPKAEQKTIVLDDQGAAFEQKTPEWLLRWNTGGNTAVQNNIKDYKAKSVFVLFREDPASKDFALSWVTGTEGPRQVAAAIATTVTSNIKSTLISEIGQADEGAINRVADVLVNASFNGLTLDAQWWQQTRNTTTGAEAYRAFSLWLIDTKNLNNQIAKSLSEIIGDRNRSLSQVEQAAYQRIINDYLEGTGVLDFDTGSGEFVE